MTYKYLAKRLNILVDDCDVIILNMNNNDTILQLLSVDSEITEYKRENRLKIIYYK